MTSSRRTLRTLTRPIPILAFCTFFAPVALAQRSATDIESARQLYNQGIGLRDKGDMAGALEKLKAAHALGNTPITGVELCKTHAALAQPVEAREVCLGVARIAPLAGETSRSQEARSEATRIAEDVKTKIAVVRLTITGVPPGREATVTVDGAPVPAAAFGQARALNPGKHELVAKVGSGAETRSSLVLEAGESKDITLPVQAPPDEPAPPPGSGNYVPGEPPPTRSRSNPLATASFIVGGVGVGVGAIAGLVALSGKSSLQDNCTDNICGTADHGTLDSARTWGNVATAGFIVGGAGLLVGLIATVAAPKATALGNASRAVAQANRRVSVTPDLGPGGVGFHGSF